MIMESKYRKREKRISANALKPRRALIVTPSSTKAMDVSGGVAKVVSNKMCNHQVKKIIGPRNNYDLALKIFSDL